MVRINIMMRKIRTCKVQNKFNDQKITDAK